MVMLGDDGVHGCRSPHYSFLSFSFLSVLRDSFITTQERGKGRQEPEDAMLLLAK